MTTTGAQRVGLAAPTDPNGNGSAPECSDAIVHVRLDGTIGSWDGRARSMFGRASANAIGRPFSALFPPSFRDDVDRLSATPSDLRRVLTTAMQEDGTRFEAEITVTRNGASEFVAVIRDVTERRAVEAGLIAFSWRIDSRAALATLATELRRWVSFIDFVVAVIDGDHYRRVFRDGIPATRALDGHNLQRAGSPVRLVLRRGNAVVVQDTSARRFRYDGRLAASGVGSYAVMPLWADGRVFATLNVGFRDAGAASTRVVRLLDGVAEAIGPPVARAIALEEASRAVSRLEQVGRRERESLALINHDMRVPLAVISGFAARLREDWEQLPEQERLEGLDAIIRNGSNLRRLVEQNLELALADAGRLSYEISAFDLRSQIETIAHDFASTAEACFEVRLGGPLPLVRGDEHRSAEVLTNLLSNAVKFSPAGSLIRIDAMQRGPTVRVTVRDQGPGIPRRAGRKLFHKFSRIDGSGIPGAGLGLYMAKCMVEAQGGRIWVRSRPGEGSTFAYTLPVAAPAARAE